MQETSSKLSQLPAFAGFLLHLFFGPEDGRDMFYENIKLSQKYMT
jgi:hypothetical protein